MLKIRDVMTRHVFTVTPETTLREAADLFARHHISGAPVLAGHEVVGVVSASDLLEFIASNDGRDLDTEDRSESASQEQTRDEFLSDTSSLYFSDQSPESDSDDASFRMDNTPPDDLFGQHTVAEVMTRDIRSLAPDADVSEAAECMWQAGIHRLLVLDGTRLSGIVSMSDVARTLATST